ncbi:aminomethyl-transferring glycine dehydrogenase subunit GcvPA [Candidatus Heimdallarchaeota archaeon]|nr:MAG: aminomethyl-transferring glycine dehydrogenase subunit GcvPA [Candidatus Gerdarchaeota archaeon]RLI70961.1 MAG: aminomethyl-transferring glycine dehydrogenase subunit GcvPA [Candidatus Heimdallarchaeota archaeon]
MTNQKEGSADTIQKEMESYLGIRSIDELFEDIPPSVRLNRPLKLPAAKSERDLSLYLDEILSQNLPVTSFLGGGAQFHYIPALVKEVITKPELLNAYTPYQPEVSQGMLQGLFEYQSLINELTGMNVTNASMYDWPTAIAEALLMCRRLFNNRTKVLLPQSIHPDRLSVVENYLAGPKISYELISFNKETGELDLEDLRTKMNENVAAVYLENPNSFGVIESEAATVSRIVHEKGAKLIVGVDPISLALLEAPANYGADIVVGEGQGLGTPLSFGGPYFGFFSLQYDRKIIRQMPGRVVGLTKTKDGTKRAFVLTLSTREQHIRREKATSNICSNESILAFGAGVYLSLLGANGLRKTAEYCLKAAHYLASEINKLKHFEAPIFKGQFYNEFVVRVTKGTMAEVETRLVEEGFVGGYTLEKCHPELGETAIFCTTEMHTFEDIDRFLKVLRKIDKDLGGGA